MGHADDMPMIWLRLWSLKSGEQKGTNEPLITLFSSKSTLNPVHKNQTLSIKGAHVLHTDDLCNPWISPRRGYAEPGGMDNVENTHDHYQVLASSLKHCRPLLSRFMKPVSTIHQQLCFMFWTLNNISHFWHYIMSHETIIGHGQRTSVDGWCCLFTHNQSSMNQPLSFR